MEKECTTGIEEIDKQHRELLDRMEVLRDHVRRGQASTAVQQTLRFLQTYMADHFATEEKYMQRYNYPGILLHKAEHELFLKDFAALKEKFISQLAQGEITTFLGLDIVRKLSEWFSNHITTIDQKMGEFLAERVSI